MISNSPKIKIIAHRGGVVDPHRSENSFAALEEAIRRGYTHVEIDARITGDGHVVCFHNDELLEEAGIQGKISKMPLREVVKITLTRSGEKIPTFEEYCAHCAGRIAVMIDLKGCNTKHIPTYTHEIEGALRTHNLLDDALILINKIPVNNQETISQHFFGLSKVSWRHSLPTTQNAAQQNPTLSKHYYVFNHFQDFTQENLVSYQSLGFEVIVSINTHHYKNGSPQPQGEHNVRQVLEWGANGLQIDSCYDIVL
ncbi:MAG: glycerophosphodiester phosphodiesterase family protein [Candidatus Latescibacteria bacterium]|nr:glycerophosphodiester phosphodiesterase family protein [Candidatus Latescibacterota bacterium]MBT4139795.1 glycerophosphodiester phosphodiesterase family protein [Candidatus Latescibacterota bacterium]